MIALLQIDKMMVEIIDHCISSTWSELCEVYLVQS